MRIPARWRRIIAALVLVQLGLLLAVALAWNERSDERGSNGRLRGSKPPAGARMPDLSGVAGVAPSMPTPRAARGSVQVLVATCIGGDECRSGDVMGGFLGRLAADDIPDDVDVRAIVWGGSVDAWRAEWDVPGRVQVSLAETGAATERVQRILGVGASGELLVGDAAGRWRSTFHLGQLDRRDLRHDLEQLG